MHPAEVRSIPQKTRRRLAVIFLDFDGVILESNEPKERAFRQAFEVFGEKAASAMAFSEAHSAITRYEKVDRIFREILHREPTPEVTAPIFARINQLAFENVVASEEVPGALAFLERFGSLVPLHVVSATPIDQLVPVLEARRFTHYFAGVHGVPPPKAETFRRVLSQLGASPSEAVFIGDSASDLEAADAAGIPFLGRDAGKPFGGQPAAVINDFCEIDAVLQALKLDDTRHEVTATF